MVLLMSYINIFLESTGPDNKLCSHFIYAILVRIVIFVSIKNSICQPEHMQLDWLNFKATKLVK